MDAEDPAPSCPWISPGGPADMAAFRDLGRGGKGALVIARRLPFARRLAGRPQGRLARRHVLFPASTRSRSITTGEGGAVLDRRRQAGPNASSNSAQHGVTKAPSPTGATRSASSRRTSASPISSARLGLSQLRQARPFRRAGAPRSRAAYEKDLAGVEGLRLPPPAALGACAWHLYPVRVPAPRPARAVFRRPARGRDRRPGPLRPRSTAIRSTSASAIRTPCARRPKRISDEEISLPMFPTLAETDRAAVVAAAEEDSSPARVSPAARP